MKTLGFWANIGSEYTKKPRTKGCSGDMYETAYTGREQEHGNGPRSEAD